MNEFIDILWKTMGIVFLFVLTLFLFSWLVEYVKLLWARHKFFKSMKKPPIPNPVEISDEARKKIEKILEKELKENNIDFEIEKNK